MFLLLGSIARGDVSAPNPKATNEACRELHDFKFPTHIGADGLPDEVVTRTFDALGRVASEKSHRDDAPDRTMWFDYDGEGRLVRERRIVNNRLVSVTTHRYDRAGHEIEIGIDEDVDGRADWITYKAYDSHGRPARVRENVKAGTNRRGLGVWYQYDLNNRIVLEKVDTDADGTPDNEVAYAYDARGLLVDKRSTWYDHSKINDHFTYTYDDAGRLTRETDRLGFTWVRRYDDRGRLVEKLQEVPPHLVDRTPMVRITYDYNCRQTGVSRR